MYFTNTKWVFKGKPKPAYSHLGKKFFFLGIFKFFIFFFNFCSFLFFFKVFGSFLFFLKFLVVFHFFLKFLFFYYEKVSPRIHQGAKKAPRLGLQATIIKRINTYQSRRHMKKIIVQEKKGHFREMTMIGKMLVKSYILMLVKF